MLMRPFALSCVAEAARIPMAQPGSARRSRHPYTFDAYPWILLHAVSKSMITSPSAFRTCTCSGPWSRGGLIVSLEDVPLAYKNGEPTRAFCTWALIVLPLRQFRRSRGPGSDTEDKQHHVFEPNYEQEKLLSGDPKEVVRYDIGLRSIANAFKTGHRIRVAILNALDNYSFPNSNTGKNEATVTETVVGKMAVHHSAYQALYGENGATLQFFSIVYLILILRSVGLRFDALQWRRSRIRTSRGL